MTRISTISCALCAAFVSATTGLQTRHVEPPATIRLNVNLTLLHVAVSDHAGQFVAGLDKRDFQLFVDGASCPITVFEPDDAPVAAGILVDNSASMIGKDSDVIAGSLAFARASNPEDEMFVVHFSDQARLGLPPDKAFTGSISELESALSSFSPEGATALYDAVALAISHLRGAKLERKVLLIISDGGDNSSHEHLADVLLQAQKASVTIYCIGIYDNTDRDQNPRVLKEFAAVTGGQAFFPASLRDVTETCLKIAATIRLQYTLGFEGQEDGQYHRIEVAVQNQRYGGLRVRTQPGYFAPKP